MMRLSNHLATPEGGERFLKWLTYALFSKDAAASSVTSLEIDVGFRPEDAAGITRVLEARNPAEPLLDTTMVTLVAPRSRFPSSRGRRGRGRGRGRTPVPPPVPHTPAFVEIIGGEDEEDRDLGFAVVKAGTATRRLMTTRSCCRPTASSVSCGTPAGAAMSTLSSRPTATASSRVRR